MYSNEKSDLRYILFVIVVFFLARGIPGLVDLGKAILFNIWVFLQVLPFFKWELLAAIIKILWGFL
jgi:hypothetical protein